MQRIINTLLMYKCKVTAYVFNEKPVLFCLAINISEPKEIWHIANLCRNNHYEMGSPEYDKNLGCLYFPRLVLDEETFNYIEKAVNV